MWGSLTDGLFVGAIDYLAALLFSIVTVPLDILLLPFELVAFILYFIKEKRGK